MKLGKLKRDSSGRGPHVKLKRLAADKAYGNHRIRAWLKKKRIPTVMPHSGREKSLIARLEQHRRIATRKRRPATSDDADPRDDTAVALILQTCPSAVEGACVKSFTV